MLLYSDSVRNELFACLLLCLELSGGMNGKVQIRVRTQLNRITLVCQVF